MPVSSRPLASRASWANHVKDRVLALLELLARGLQQEGVIVGPRRGGQQLLRGLTDVLSAGTRWTRRRRPGVQAAVLA